MIKVTVPVRSIGGGRFEIKYLDEAGMPVRKKFSHREDADAEAKRVAKRIAEARPDELSVSESAIFRKAVVALFGVPKTVLQVCEDYAAALRIAPGRTMVELATSFVQTNKSGTGHSELTVTAAAEQFLNILKLRGVADRTYGGHKSLLTRFSKAFQCRAVDVTDGQVQAWVLGLPKINGRTRNNYLGGIKEFFSSGELKKLPYAQAIRDLAESKEAPPKKYLWTPKEFRSMLEMTLLPYTPERKDGRKYEHSHMRVLPFMVLGGLAGVRSESEIMHLCWEDIRLDDAMIVVMSKKTGNERIIPLPDAAVAWLRLCPDREGRLWTWSADTLHKNLGELAVRCGLTWRRNALRKSRITYQMLLEPNTHAAARYAGNSSAMVSKNYLAAIQADKTQAHEWFAIMPPSDAAEKVVAVNFKA